MPASPEFQVYRERAFRAMFRNGESSGLKEFGIQSLILHNPYDLSSEKQTVRPVNMPTVEAYTPIENYIDQSNDTTEDSGFLEALKEAEDSDEFHALVDEANKAEEKPKKAGRPAKNS